MSNKNPPILTNPQLSQADINQLNNWMQGVAKNGVGAGGATSPAQINVTTPTRTVIEQQAITMNTPFNVIEIPFTLNQANYAISTDGIFAFDFTGTLSAVGTFNIIFTKPTLFIVDNKTVGNFGVTITNSIVSYSLPAASGSKILYYDGSAIEDAFTIINTSSNGIPVRQTVLYSPVNTSGLPTFLPASSTAATQMNAPYGVAVDNVNDEIFVANYTGNSITVYGRTANGNVAPTRTISGAATTLNGPQGITVDTTNNEIIIANSLNSSILVFSRTANGNVAPIRTISGAATTLGTPRGIAIDTTNNEIMTTDASNSILVFSRTANGNVAPTRTISGAATTLNLPRQMYIDTANNEIGVANQTGNSITIFNRTDSGNVAPIRTISGAATGLNSAIGIAVDIINNEIIVGNTAGPITVYTRTANGNIAPTRTISGAATGLGYTYAVAVDTINNEITGINSNSNCVEVFSRTANGNVAPLRSIGGLTLSTVNVTSTATLVATASYRDSDNKGTSIVNLTWPQCTNTATNYLPLLVSDGLLTPQPPVTLAPIYQWGGTPATTAGQYTFNIQEMTMYLGNGTTAPAVNHIIVGEAVAAGGNITSTVTYPLMKNVWMQSNKAIFTASGNWTCPSNVTTAYASGAGGGGGGGGSSAAGVAYSGGGGGAGQSTTKQAITVVPGTVYAVTIGAGGAGGVNAAGASGGTTSLGALLTLAGGGGGGYGNGSASVGGLYGGGVADPAAFGASGFGGSSPFGIGGKSRSSAEGNGIGYAGNGYGSGGSGSIGSTASAGGAGTAGILILEW